MTRAARRGRRRSPSAVAAAASPIDDVRGTAGVPPPRAARAHAARARAVRRMRIELTVNGERARGRRLGGREPPLRAARAARAARARRTRASRASAARARCCSTASSCAPASCSRAQADGHEVVTVEGLADGRARCTGAGGVRRRGRRPVRVLHAGVRRRRRRPARAASRPERGRDPRGAVRQPLPLHRLREDPRRRPAGGRARDDVTRASLRDRPSASSAAAPTACRRRPASSRTRAT